MLDIFKKVHVQVIQYRYASYTCNIHMSTQSFTCTCSITIYGMVDRTFLIFTVNGALKFFKL